jgi:mono/diheme cytochrome c family protein
MKKQVNYIAIAMLLLFSITIVYFFINKIVSANDMSQGRATANNKMKSAMTDTVTQSVYLGKILFNNKCAACHTIFRTDSYGFEGFADREPWNDREQLYAWIRNPEAFTKKNKYAQDLKAKYGSMMTAFPDLKNEEIDAIVDYVNFGNREKIHLFR